MHEFSDPLVKILKMTITRLVQFAFVACFVLALVDALSGQTQMWLIGRVLLPEFVTKIGVFVIVVGFCLKHPREVIDIKLLLSWLLLLSGVIISYAVQAVALPAQKDQLGDLMANYLYLACLPFCLLCRERISSIKPIFVIFSILLVPLCALGIAQYLSGFPIVPTNSPDGSFQVTSWQLEGKVRAFSLFATSLSFSYYLALMGAYCAAFLFSRRGGVKRMFACIGCLIVLLSTYATMTRLGFIQVGYSALVAGALSRGRYFSKVKWSAIPLFGLAVSILVVTAGPALSKVTSSDVFVDTSLHERLEHWGDAVNTWTQNGPAVFVFGTGVSQSSSAAHADYIVDNTFLNFAVQSGLLGLLFATSFMFVIWARCRDIYRLEKSPEVIAIIAFWSTWMLTGFLNTTNPVYALVGLPLFISFGPQTARRGRSLLSPVSTFGQEEWTT